MFLAAGDAQASIMADHLAVSRPSVTAVVDGLVARGLVDRRHDNHDRRRVGHSITEEGRRLLDAADATLDQTLDEILDYSTGAAARRIALQGFAAWEEALDAKRAARKAEKGELSEGAPRVGAAG